MREAQALLKLARELVSESYEDAKLKKQELDDRVDKLSDMLNKKYPINGGLLPEEIRLSPQYRRDKGAFDRAFRELQNFNKMFMRKFKKEYAQERRERRKRRYE
jgi:hypothetical protein